MEKGVIDLTVSPTPIYINVDCEESSTTQNVAHTDIQNVNDQERKKARRKKRKRPERGSASSTTHTREHSAEQEIERRKSNERLANCSSPQLSDDNGRRRTQHPTYQHFSPPSLKQPSSRDISDFFFIDIEPALLPPAALFDSLKSAEGSTMNPLLLPAHVSVFGNEPVEILPTTLDPDEDYIDYLDFDDSSKNVVRYFEDSIKEPSKHKRTVCKNCGAEGEHSTVSCPVMICLTCGARDEHSTRSCPISKTCFTCGMKGHINVTCPNRQAIKCGDVDGYDDCGRCGASYHKTNECPTLWRLYEYLTTDAKNFTLQERTQRQHLRLGEGGEGYIADGEWCYNCGNFGHWGDDCLDLSHVENIPKEPSAFSEHNTLSGPFSNTTVGITSLTRRREPREWGLENDSLETWGNNLPENVGKRSRRNNMAKLERRALEQDRDVDSDDWFRNPKNIRNSGVPQSNGPSRKLTFGKSVQESGRQFNPPSPPSLLARLGDDYHSKNSRHDSRSRKPRSSNSQNRLERDKQDGRRTNERDHWQRNDPGPRYRGGYSR